MTNATRHILLCATGLSPQIVTETLYGLAVKGDFIPDEIHLITTQEGEERARLNLLSDEPGWFHRLCRDFALPAINFSHNTIHVLRTLEGACLSDIRNEADNRHAADAITAIVRELTQNPASQLHVSIAGGRKTMGFYTGYALSLFGREQDQLSHVLVAPPYESHPDFYYPTPYTRVIHTPPPDSRPLDTAKAEVTLAHIPFVRLRGHLDEVLLSDGASYSQTVRRAQRSVDPPKLLLDSATRRVRCGDRLIQLTPVDFAFYAWFARQAQNLGTGICRTDISPAERDAYLAEYRSVVGEFAGDYERIESALQNGMDHDYFDQRCSRLHKTLYKNLGRTGAQPYLIISDRKRPRSCYRLGLHAEQIRFAALSKDNDDDDN